MQAHTLSIQEKLFQKIREVYNKENPIQEILAIIPQSPSSVYKKLSLQRPLNVEDLVILCKHFNLSIDQLIVNS